MSLFKSRSGGSLFRFKAISGYLKVLFDNRHSDKTEVENVMKAKYKISDQ
ncbi:hypothetical protein [Psychrobacillus phage Perkons]|nr:hypothetical protein [Psychrobacillus phage Perkons]